MVRSRSRLTLPSSKAPAWRTGTTRGRVVFALLSLIAFAIPWENTLVLPGLGTISRLLGLVTLPVALFAILHSGRVRMPSAALILMGVFVAWGSLSYWWTTDAEATITAITTWLQCLGLVWLIWELAPQRERLLMLARAYVLGTLVSCGDTILSYANHSTRLYERYAASGFDPNDLGLLLALSLPISFYLATIPRYHGAAWLYRLQQVAVIVAIGLTSSRAALIALIVALSYLPVASLKMTLQQKCSIFMALVIATGAAMTFLPESSWKRWSGTANELKEGTLSDRRLIWAVGFEMFRLHPLAGIGAGAFSQGVRSIWPRGQVAHNTFLSVLVEEGVIGLGFLLLLLLSLALQVLKLPNPERAVWLLVLATWVVGVNSLTWEPRKSTWFFFALVATRVSDMTVVRKCRPIPQLHKRGPGYVNSLLSVNQ
jgi:O-antigen ligase